MDRDWGAQKVVIHYTSDDVIAAQMLHAGMTRKAKVVLSFFFSALLLIIFLIADNARERLFLYGVAVISGFVAYSLQRFVYIPWSARRHYAAHPLMQVEQTLSYGEGGVHYVSDRGDTKLQWQDFILWRANEKMLLLYVAPKLFLFIPKRLQNTHFDIEGMQRMAA